MYLPHPRKIHPGAREEGEALSLKLLIALNHTSPGTPRYRVGSNSNGIHLRFCVDPEKSLTGA